MRAAPFTGRARVGGVVGAPIRHSLSPLIHNAWIAAAGLDALYVPIQVQNDGFSPLIDALRRSSVRGVNVTIPFKEEALALAGRAEPLARAAGAANLLLFGEDGVVEARNTDGPGLLSALAEQAPAWRVGEGPVVILGAGGGGRGAAAALNGAGVQEVRVVNRTLARAEALAQMLPGVCAFSWSRIEAALSGATLIVNATSVGLGGGELAIPWDSVPGSAVALDMVYRPLQTPFLQRAAQRGCRAVDGLAMLIAQARPTFEALFGRPPPAEVDVRALALTALGALE